MEEYAYKLSQNNPILTLDVMNKITRKMRTFHYEGNKSEFQKYYNFLREHCISGTHSKTVTAMRSLIELAQSEDILTLSNLHKDMMSSLSTAENLSGIVELIFHSLFRLNNVYDIMYNQHPLISILKRNQSTWTLILAKIGETFQTQPKAKVLQILQPFAMYVLYDDDNKIDRVLQLEMLEIYRLYFDRISWQKIIVLNSAHLRRSILYCKVLQLPDMLAYLITAIHSLLAKDEDATEALWLVKQFVSSNTHRNYSLEIVLLSECVALTPAMNMKTLCESLMLMLSTREYSSIIQSTAKSALCCWKLHSSSALCETVEKIINLSENISTSQEVHEIEYNELLDAKQFLIAYALQNELTAEQLQMFRNACSHLKLKLFTIFLAHLYNNVDAEMMLSILELCLDCCSLNSKLAFQLLPVLLHKLSMCYSSPAVHLAILRALPAMGRLKENLQTIIMIIKAMASNSPQTHAMCLALMTDLVLVDKSCFPYFEELLALNANTKNHDLIVAKAYSVRRMCALMIPNGLENYRKELAIHESFVLAKYHSNILAVGFALEGLVDLCHGMNAYNTYESLAERFENDDRERVIIGMCKIMRETAHIPDLQNPKCERIIKSLFAHIQSTQSRSISQAAYEALSQFTVEQISLGYPSNFTHEMPMPGNISGASWICLLQKTPRIGLNAAGSMLIQLITTDFKMFLRPTHTDHHVEPMFMNLNRDHILASVAKYVKRESSKYLSGDKDVYIECLRILAHKYERPLPAMDWTFLNNLQNDKSLQKYILTIAAHQSSVSNSARNFLETSIKTLTESQHFTEEFHHVFTLLPQIANTIQPSVMKPFFRNALTLTMPSIDDNKQVKGLNAILENVGKMLQDGKVSESNKIAATEVLLSIMDGYETEAQEFQLLLPVLGRTKAEYLGETCWPGQYECLNARILMRCLSIRSASALYDNANPFHQLDSIIDCRAVKSFEISTKWFEEILLLVSPVFEKYRDHHGFPLWLNELFVKIEVELAEKRDLNAVAFQSLIVLIAIVVVSGYHIFTRRTQSFNDFVEVLPWSLVHLLTSKLMVHSPHILESMYDYSTNVAYKHNDISEAISSKYKHTILLMRSEDAFNERLKWMKYIEINP